MEFKLHSGGNQEDFFRFPHLAKEACLAICFRRLSLKALARAFPPLSPPKRPSSTAAGFRVSGGGVGSSRSPMAKSTMNLARWFGSLGRLGFSMP
jgi:hypothetical protein